MNTENSYVMLVRLRPGVVGERERVVHVVLLSDDNLLGDDADLTACCGAELARADVDYLDRPTGMPCVSCLAATPLPGPPSLAES